MSRTAISLAIIAMLIICSTSDSAGVWLELFSAEDHSSICLDIQPGEPNLVFNCYFFARASVEGFVATDCKIQISDPAISINNSVYHPNMNLAEGDWLTGMILNFNECMTGYWILCATIEMQINSPGLQPNCVALWVRPSDETGFFGVRSCVSGNPWEFSWHEFNIYINCDYCPDATEALSWGAIKNLYNH